jgi:hypothetical protein
MKIQFSFHIRRIRRHIRGGADTQTWLTFTRVCFLGALVANSLANVTHHSVISYVGLSLALGASHGVSRLYKRRNSDRG